MMMCEHKTTINHIRTGNTCTHPDSRTTRRCLYKVFVCVSVAGGGPPAPGNTCPCTCTKQAGTHVHVTFFRHHRTISSSFCRSLCVSADLTCACLLQNSIMMHVSKSSLTGKMWMAAARPAPTHKHAHKQHINHNSTTREPMDSTKEEEQSAPRSVQIGWLAQQRALQQAYPPWPVVVSPHTIAKRGRAHASAIAVLMRPMESENHRDHPVCLPRAGKGLSAALAGLPRHLPVDVDLETKSDVVAREGWWAPHTGTPAHADVSSAVSWAAVESLRALAHPRDQRVPIFFVLDEAVPHPDTEKEEEGGDNGIGCQAKTIAISVKVLAERCLVSHEASRRLTEALGRAMRELQRSEWFIAAANAGAERLQTRYALTSHPTMVWNGSGWVLETDPQLCSALAPIAHPHLTKALPFAAVMPPFWQDRQNKRRVLAPVGEANHSTWSVVLQKQWTVTTPQHFLEAHATPPSNTDPPTTRTPQQPSFCCNDLSYPNYHATSGRLLSGCLSSRLPWSTSWWFRIASAITPTDPIIFGEVAQLPCWLRYPDDLKRCGLRCAPPPAPVQNLCDPLSSLEEHDEAPALPLASHTTVCHYTGWFLSSTPRWWRGQQHEESGQPEEALSAKLLEAAPLPDEVLQELRALYTSPSSHAPTHLHLLRLEESEGEVSDGSPSQLHTVWVKVAAEAATINSVLPAAVIIRKEATTRTSCMDACTSSRQEKASGLVMAHGHRLFVDIRAAHHLFPHTVMKKGSGATCMDHVHTASGDSSSFISSGSECGQGTITPASSARRVSAAFVDHIVQNASAVCQLTWAERDAWVAAYPQMEMEMSLTEDASEPTTTLVPKIHPTEHGMSEEDAARAASQQHFLNELELLREEDDALATDWPSIFSVGPRMEDAWRHPRTRRKPQRSRTTTSPSTTNRHSCWPIYPGIPTTANLFSADRHRWKHQWQPWVSHLPALEDDASPQTPGQHATLLSNILDPCATWSWHHSDTPETSNNPPPLHILDLGIHVLSVTTTTHYVNASNTTFI